MSLKPVMAMVHPSQQPHIAAVLFHAYFDAWNDKRLR